MKTLQKVIKTIIVFILCGFSYSLVKDNVIPNIKHRLDPTEYVYHIFIDDGTTSKNGFVIVRKPWFEDGVFYYYDDYNNLVTLYNRPIRVIETTGDKPV